MILQQGIVPTAFGKGIVIPLVKNIDGNRTDSSNYRGITLSPVISKLFELVLMDQVQDKLTSSNLQFGFKKKSSCSHAILALQVGIEHICNSGGTATICALDISKAFDRVNFYGLFKNLIDKSFPKCFIRVLLDWFTKSVSYVQWNGFLSLPYSISAGVGQGGGFVVPCIICYVYGCSYCTAEEFRVWLQSSWILYWMFMLCR